MTHKNSGLGKVELYFAHTFRTYKENQSSICILFLFSCDGLHSEGYLMI